MAMFNFDDPITIQRREEAARKRETENRQKQQQSQQQKLIDELEPLTTDVTWLLIQEGIAARGNDSAARNLHELARFIAYGLTHEADLTTYCTFIGSRNSTISYIRGAVIRVWANPYAQSQIFPNWADKRTHPEPALPTIMYGLYNWVSRHYSQLKTKLPEPKQMPLNVT